MDYSKTHPLALESAYAYTAKDGTCQDSTIEGVVGVSSVNKVWKYFSWPLLSALEKGPVSVTVRADQPAFRGFTSGVVNADCGSQLNHAITAVGYKVLENGKIALFVRNSWGPDWGDAGHIYIQTESFGMGVCGIQQVSVYPTTN